MFILVLPIQIFNPIQFMMDTHLELITWLYLLAAQLCTGVFFYLIGWLLPGTRHFAEDVVHTPFNVLCATEIKGLWPSGRLFHI